MQPHTLTLLRILADGQFHSGAVLADTLSVSRTTIWQRIGELQAQGFPIDCVRGRGYHLAQVIELLDLELLNKGLAPNNVWQLHYEPVLTSTMDYWDKQALPHAQVCIAELQLKGRGRQGRSWINPFATTLTFSVTWQFHKSMTQLSGLSLAVGVMLRRVLNLPHIQLKWPNDLVVEGKKLGGILIELRGEMQGPCTAIIGIGFNFSLKPMDAKYIDKPWCDLKSLAGNPHQSRNELLLKMLHELQIGLTQFSEDGFSAFQNEWSAVDSLFGKQITLESASGDITGIVKGVDDSGQLILEQGGLTRLCASGEIVHVKNIHEFA